MLPTKNLPELLRVGQALDWAAGETGLSSILPEGLGKTLGSSEPCFYFGKWGQYSLYVTHRVP